MSETTLQGSSDEAETGTHLPPRNTSFPKAEASSTSPNVLSRARDHLAAPVRPSGFAELELILLTFCTGIQGQSVLRLLDIPIPADETLTRSTADAISFPEYHCFASNQTGNTVFLMLAIILPHLDGEMFITANIGVALGFFLAAGWLTGQLSHIVGPRRRGWLILCNFIQSCLVFAAGAIQHVYGTDLTGPRTLVVIGLLAFAAGSQVVQSRSLQMTEISTAMATAAWVDLMIDPNLFVLKNRPRTRRVAFLASLVLGSLLGAYIYKTAGSAVALFVSAGGKLLVTAMYLFNGEDKKVPSSETV